MFLYLVSVDGGALVVCLAYGDFYFQSFWGKDPCCVTDPFGLELLFLFMLVIEVPGLFCCGRPAGIFTSGQAAESKGSAPVLRRIEHKDREILRHIFFVICSLVLNRGRGGEINVEAKIGPAEKCNIKEYGTGAYEHLPTKFHGCSLKGSIQFCAMTIGYF